MNTTCDSSANTILLSISFLILSYAERSANISSFNDNIVVKNLLIGIGFTPFEKSDSTAIFILYNKGI